MDKLEKLKIRMLYYSEQIKTLPTYADSSILQAKSEVTEHWIDQIDKLINEKQKLVINIVPHDLPLIRTYNKEIKQEIQRLILEKFSSFKEFASEIQITEAGLSRIFNQDGIPKKQTFKKIFKGLKIENLVLTIN